MNIDWTKPLELVDGTLVVLSKHGLEHGDRKNPDGDGDYWVLTQGAVENSFNTQCFRADGRKFPGGAISIRNRADTPIETANADLLEMVRLLRGTTEKDCQVVPGAVEDRCHEAADMLAGTAALRKALEDLEACGSGVIAAVDAYNEKHGTFLCGGPLFKLARAIGSARQALNPPPGEDQ